MKKTQTVLGTKGTRHPGIRTMTPMAIAAGILLVCSSSLFADSTAAPVATTPISVPAVAVAPAPVQSVQIALQAPGNGEELDLIRPAHEHFFSAFEACGKDGFPNWEQLLADGDYSTTPLPVQFKWIAPEGAACTVELSRTPEFADSYAVPADETGTLEIKNLELGRTYHWRVRTETAEGSVWSETWTFNTRPGVPRFLRVAGTKNVRDLGGWSVPGGHIRQGLVFRGANLDAVKPSGREVLLGWIGIKTDLDLRRESKNNGVSPLGNDVLYHLCVVDSYKKVFEKKGSADSYREIFRILADRNNYPLYFHCKGGADRARTLAMVLEAVLGVNEDDIRADYELTVFSHGLGWAKMIPDRYARAMEGVRLFGKEGDSIGVCAENFLLHAGVTPEQIAKFREIMVEPDAAPGTGTCTASDAAVLPPPEPVAPADGAEVKMLTPCHEEFFKEAAERSTDQELDWNRLFGIGGKLPIVPAVPVLAWNPGTWKEFSVEVSETPGFEAPVTIKPEKGATSVQVKNLKIGTRYYWRVTGSEGCNMSVSAPLEFATDPRTPRYIYAAGVSNVRDLGGWRCAGGRVRQNLVFRGGRLDGVKLEGRDVLLERFGVKTDVDLRKDAKDFLKESPLDESVAWKYCPVNAYGSVFTNEVNRARYREIFGILADRDNYPVYFHCDAGADRAGTLAIVIESVLGLDENDIRADYMLTALSLGEKWASRIQPRYSETIAALRKHGGEGDSLQVCAEKFLMGGGVSREEIDRFRDIMVEPCPDCMAK